ncbi:MAG: hypothetical protein RB191_18065 [Terriglobia bacterium]|nr:hypothetical protein [Terriglobia bacterium]
MAIGDQADFFSRLKAQIPASWFQSSPNFDATLQGPAWALSSIYAQITYAALQTRIKTATDGYLDLISNDFFGTTLPRTFNETDDAFRARILANLFVNGPTRGDMVAVLTLLTGNAPVIFEPWNPSDTGGYDVGGVAYDLAGGWGDILVAQAFIVAYRPEGQGIPLIAGYDSSSGAYDTGSRAEYIDDTMYAGVAPDSAIYAAISATHPVGVEVWVRIANYPPPPITLPNYYPPALAFDPPPANVVVTSDGSYVIDAEGDYVVHA